MRIRCLKECEHGKPGDEVEVRRHRARACIAAGCAEPADAPKAERKPRAKATPKAERPKAKPADKSKAAR